MTIVSPADTVAVARLLPQVADWPGTVYVRLNRNEVPVLLGAALRQAAPIVALHLTRPNITIPDRAKLGMPSHYAAARAGHEPAQDTCRSFGTPSGILHLGPPDAWRRRSRDTRGHTC